VREQEEEKDGERKHGGEQCTNEEVKVEK